MSAVARFAQSEEDFWKVRRLLEATWELMPPAFAWDVRRWDGSYFHDALPGWDDAARRRIRLWESPEGELLGAAHPEGESDVWLQVRPQQRHLEDEMLTWAEEALRGPDPEGGQRLLAFAFDYDIRRQRLLEGRGYEKLEAGEVMRRQFLEGVALPEPALPVGYSIAATREGAEGNQAVADLLNAAFRRDIHSAAEYETFTRLSPSYRRDLDRVVLAPGGELAAMAALIYDDRRRYGLFEPVCTHPEHFRKGLASALMLDGMRRIQAEGAREVFVGTGIQAAANALYESLGFTEVHQGRYWRKRFAKP